MTASTFGIGSPINPLQISPWSGAPYGPHAFATFGSQPQQYTPSPLGSAFGVPNIGTPGIGQSPVIQILQQLQGVPHQVQYLQYSQLQQNQLLQQIQQVLQILPQQVQQLQQVIQFLPQQIAQVLQQVLIPGSFAAAAPGFTGLAMGQLGSLAGSPVGQTGLPFQTLQPGPNQPGYVM
jgi:hypothetical protein